MTKKVDENLLYNNKMEINSPIIIANGIYEAEIIWTFLCYTNLLSFAIWY